MPSIPRSFWCNCLYWILSTFYTFFSSFYSPRSIFAASTTPLNLFLPLLSSIPVPRNIPVWSVPIHPFRPFLSRSISRPFPFSLPVKILYALPSDLHGYSPAYTYALIIGIMIYSVNFLACLFSIFFVLNLRTMNIGIVLNKTWQM